MTLEMMKSGLTKTARAFETAKGTKAQSLSRQSRSFLEELPIFVDSSLMKVVGERTQAAPTYRATAASAERRSLGMRRLW